MSALQRTLDPAGLIAFTAPPSSALASSLESSDTPTAARLSLRDGATVPVGPNYLDAVIDRLKLTKV